MRCTGRSFWQKETAYFPCIWGFFDNKAISFCRGRRRMWASHSNRCFATRPIQPPPPDWWGGGELPTLTLPELKGVPWAIPLVSWVSPAQRSVLMLRRRYDRFQCSNGSDFVGGFVIVGACVGGSPRRVAHPRAPHFHWARRRSGWCRRSSCPTLWCACLCPLQTDEERGVWMKPPTQQNEAYGPPNDYRCDNLINNLRRTNQAAQNP